MKFLNLEVLSSILYFYIPTSWENFSDNEKISSTKKCFTLTFLLFRSLHAMALLLKKRLKWVEFPGFSAIFALAGVGLLS